MEIAKEYLVDESGNIKSVLIDIEQYRKIEPIILDHALGEAMTEIEDEEEIDLDDALKLINNES
jgi:hypothetical protein